MQNLYKFIEESLFFIIILFFIFYNFIIFYKYKINRWIKS